MSKKIGQNGQKRFLVFCFSADDLTHKKDLTNKKGTFGPIQARGSLGSLKTPKSFYP